MAKSKDLTVFIGRFSPFHYGHATVLKRALDTSKAALVLVGSSGQARTTKNPFTFEERRKMILDWVWNTYRSGFRLDVKPIYDHPYNDQAWIRGVQDAVDQTKADLVDSIGLNPKVYLTGADRDRSTWYLNAFGDFFNVDLLDATHADTSFELSATRVRDWIFNVNTTEQIDKMVPETTLAFIKDFVDSSIYAKIYSNLVKEFQYIEDYKRRWNLPDRDAISLAVFAALEKVTDPVARAELEHAFQILIKLAPYAPTFVTVDNFVVQSGHLLVNVRDNFPGVGLWSLPGGFLEQNEKLVDGAVRELIEETRIELSKAQLYGSIRAKEIFDHPDRSLRGRTITTCFLYKLDDSKRLPKTKPQKGEVKKVMWIPINEALNRRDKWFEDHYAMVTTMYGRIPPN